LAVSLAHAARAWNLRCIARRPEVLTASEWWARNLDVSTSAASRFRCALARRIAKHAYAAALSGARHGNGKLDRTLWMMNFVAPHYALRYPQLRLGSIEVDPVMMLAGIDAGVSLPRALSAKLNDTHMSISDQEISLRCRRDCNEQIIWRPGWPIGGSSRTFSHTHTLNGR